MRSSPLARGRDITAVISRHIDTWSKPVQTVALHANSVSIMTKPKDIDEYIAGFPKEIQNTLEQLRATIKKAAPKAEEMISYGIPTFKMNGSLVYFAAYSNHIGFYPRVSAIESFKKELSMYKGSKGTVQFPLDKPLPLELITKIVKFRVRENLQRSKTKKK